MVLGSCPLADKYITDWQCCSVHFLQALPTTFQSRTSLQQLRNQCSSVPVDNSKESHWPGYHDIILPGNINIIIEIMSPGISSTSASLSAASQHNQSFFSGEVDLERTTSCCGGHHWCHSGQLQTTVELQSNTRGSSHITGLFQSQDKISSRLCRGLSLKGETPWLLTGRGVATQTSLSV